MRIDWGSQQGATVLSRGGFDSRQRDSGTYPCGATLAAPQTRQGSCVIGLEPIARALSLLSLLLAGGLCRCCGFGGSCGFSRRCCRLGSRRRGGALRGSSSIGLFLGLLFLLFAHCRNDHAAPLVGPAGCVPLATVRRPSARPCVLRALSTLRARARRPLPLKLLSIVTS